MDVKTLESTANGDSTGMRTGPEPQERKPFCPLRNNGYPCRGWEDQVRGRGEGGGAGDVGLSFLTPGGQWFPLVTRPSLFCLRTAGRPYCSPPRAPGHGAVTRRYIHEPEMAISETGKRMLIT